MGSRKSDRSKKVKLFALLTCFILLPFSPALYALDTFTYDANGNMVQDSSAGRCYGYDDANRLVNVSDCQGNVVARYWYDYTGRRIKSIVGGVTTYYPFEDYESRLENGQLLNTTYFFVEGERVARKDPNGSMHYYLGDHLGSTVLLTDSEGNVEEETEYYPFGMILSGGSKAKHLYTGQEYDAETGLYYYGARYYSPNLMRFIQPDPVIQNVYDPQSLNRYSYVKNNPEKYTDPNGQNPLLAGVGLAYLTGSFWGIGEYMVTTGTYNPIDVFNSRNAQQLSMQRGIESAAVFGLLEVTGVNALIGGALGQVASKAKSILGIGEGTFGTISEETAQSSVKILGQFTSKDDVLNFVRNGENGLSGGVQKAANEFFKGATGKTTSASITQIKGGYQLEFFSPADNPGYGKTYVQIIDNAGNIIQEFKDTIGPGNVLIERKFIH